MDTILQEKRKGQAHFRSKVDKHLQESQYSRRGEQLTPLIMQELLSGPGCEGVCINGKVNIEKLCDRMEVSQSHHSTRQLMRALGNRKEVKVTELHQMMRSFNLTTFDIQTEMMRHFFEGDRLSINKLDVVMKGLGLPLLNSKDKEILVECFDYDRNKAVTQSDLAVLMKVLKQEGLPYKGAS